MEKEFNLSCKRFLARKKSKTKWNAYYREEDIKEFIKIIEEIVLNPKTTLIRKVGQIRAKAGSKLS